MKHKNFRKQVISAIILVSLAFLIPPILYTQAPKQSTHPTPVYFPPDLPPGLDKETIPTLEKTPTSTPDPIEAEKLPVETAPIIPTVEMIDTAPEIPHHHKDQLIIQRGKSGQTVVILVPLGADKDVILNAHLNVAEGDKLLRISQPLTIRPTPDFRK